MNADIQGALKQINKSWKAFEHNGKKLTKRQVKVILKYGLKKGYENTGQLTDEEVDTVLLAIEVDEELRVQEIYK